MTEEAAISLSDTAGVAASIHSSLRLDEILRGCLSVLREHFQLRRLSLVQHRSNEFTATLYSSNDIEGASPIRPQVIALKSSRLKECFNRKKGVEVYLSAQKELDSTERAYFAHPEASSIVYAPLLLAGKLKGMLVLALVQNGPITASQSSCLNLLTSQLSLAIENSDVHYFEKRRGRQLQMVSEIAKQAVMLEDLTEFLQTASALLRQEFNYDVVQIWALGSRQELVLKGYAYKAASGIKIGERMPPMVEECRARNETICNYDITSEAKKWASLPNTASQLTVPIRLRGKFLGVLSIECSRVDAFPVEDFGIMEGVASLIASAFDNLRMFEHTRQSNEYMQAILMSAKDQAILSTDIHGYVITSSIGSEAIFKIPYQEILGRDILTLFSDRTFRHELALYINVPELPTFQRSKIPQTEGNLSSFLDITIRRVYNAENLPIGFLCIARDMTENVQLQKTLESLSFTDELTGLYNKRRFFLALTEEIERSRRYRRKFSLCFFDLDGFKAFSDSEGHLRGDQTLKEAANLLHSRVRSNIDTCYRYGGDEFTIIMPETNRHNAEIVIQRIRRMLHEHFQGKITLSVGIVEYEEPMDANEIVEKADRAMYEAKSQGGDRIILA